MSLLDVILSALAAWGMCSLLIAAMLLAFLVPISRSPNQK